MLTTWLKKLSGALFEGQLFSGHPELLPLVLDRDWPEVERLLIAEEWPFVRGDLEVSHAQPGAAGFIARKDGRFAGFFAAHNFGSVGYLDMMIIAQQFRGAGIARPLYFKTIRELKRKGMRGFVVHTTNDSARIIRLLGFRPGINFTLIARDPLFDQERRADPERIGEEDLEELIALDARAFGMERRDWIEALAADRNVRIYGSRIGGRLTAAVCLRPRRGNAFCLDTALADDPAALAPLVKLVVTAHAESRLECFARTGSPLHGVLLKLGFAVPEFFKAIGPLTEWRKGKVGEVGASPTVQCLCWF